MNGLLPCRNDILLLKKFEKKIMTRYLDRQIKCRHDLFTQKPSSSLRRLEDAVFNRTDWSCTAGLHVQMHAKVQGRCISYVWHYSVGQVWMGMEG
jgi:hypothetical protein